MTWEPPQDFDDAICDWMDEQGWPVDNPHWDFHIRVYAWQHWAPGPGHELHMTQGFIQDEDMDAEKIIKVLESRGVADRMRETPSGSVRLSGSLSREIEVEEWPPS